jgi:hypothetical protein
MGPEAQPRERKSKPGVSLRLPSKITAVSWKDVAETLGPILLVSAIGLPAVLGGELAQSNAVRAPADHRGGDPRAAVPAATV